MHHIQITFMKKILYNTMYTVYCRDPRKLLSTGSNNSVPTVVGYHDDLIPVEGSTVWFSCSPGSELIGSYSMNCTGNGEWQPDPSLFTCNVSLTSSEG